MLETSIDHISGEDFCTVYASEIWSQNAIKKMAEEHPDCCVIIKEYEDGGVFARIPEKCIHYSFRFPSKRELTEEQKIASGERLMKAREMRKKNKEEKEKSKN